MPRGAAPQQAGASRARRGFASEDQRRASFAERTPVRRALARVPEHQPATLCPGPGRAYPVCVLTLELRKSKKVAMVLMVLIAPISFGLTLPLLLWLLWVWPTAIDEHGLVMRFGRRHDWLDLVSARPVKLMKMSQHVGWRVEFKFRSGSPRIDSFTFVNFRQAIALIEARTGKKLLEG